MDISTDKDLTKSNEITEVIFKRDRFYVRLKNFPMMPRANFVWLRANPSFAEIPKGYVVHHLDHDKTNDDPSNLVIMQKFHHIAHHFKQKTITPKISFDPFGDQEMADVDYPVKRPAVYKRPDNNNWFMLYKGQDGKQKRISRLNGKSFKSREEIEKAINEIWPNGFNG